jgi:hypothetical protein
MASTPRVALSISYLLNRRNIKILENTHRVIVWVIISESAIREIYALRDLWPEEKRKIINPVRKGKRSPEIKPIRTLSYFSVNFIF